MFLWLGWVLALQSVVGIGGFIIGQSDGRDTHTVHAPDGDIIGYTEAIIVNGVQRRVRRYTGIPHAEAPVWHLRSRKPIKKTRFDRPFDATKMVMIWIHGGAFTFGSALEYYVGGISAFGKVIAVSTNYRLGVFGCMTTGDYHARGNFGLWDQQIATQWVHNNIRAFGGDPGKVTIFGESSGSASVTYRSFHPANIGLFQRAIAQSGTFRSNWAFREAADVAGDARVIAELSGCNQDEVSDVMECLSRATESALVASQSMAVFRNGTYWTPVSDGYFLIDTPSNILKGTSSVKPAVDMQQFNSVDLIMGVTSLEGNVFLAARLGYAGMGIMHQSM